MKKSAINKIVSIALMGGVNNVQLCLEVNQIWITVIGHNETRAVVAALEGNFATKSVYWETDILSYSIYPEDLIIEIFGYLKETPSTDTESKKETRQHKFTTTEEYLELHEDRHELQMERGKF